jgi:hypothetical protein
MGVSWLRSDEYLSRQFKTAVLGTAGSLESHILQIVLLTNRGWFLGA